MNFNQVIERKHSGCFKYDALKIIYGKEDIIPLWVADMDFAVAPEITESLIKRIQHPIFGYNFPDHDFHASIRKWIQKRYNWDTVGQKVINVPSIMTALAIAVLSQTKPGDSILIQTPVYPPFFSTIIEHSRNLLTNPLISRNNTYEIDWEDFEHKAAKVKMFVLCNPHNPVSKVFSYDELKKIHQICTKHEVMVFSDEIHADIVFAPNKHQSIASFGGDNVITGISPAKSFNLAGLATAVMFAPDNKIGKTLNELNNSLHTFMGNSFGITAFTTAYMKGEHWLEALLNYLKQNRDLMRDFFLEEIQSISMAECNGTYLAWLDCRELGLGDKELNNFFIQKARLALNPGTSFGIEGTGFMRLNFATPRSVLLSALERIKQALKDM